MASVRKVRNLDDLAERAGVTAATVSMALHNSPLLSEKMRDRIQRLAEESGCVLLEKDRLFNVLLAHELFHAVEEQHADEIYTRTEKVELWRKPFSNRSSIACLSEMAAMAFARELLGLDCSPYMLDVLLVYAYDKEAAWGLYEEIGELIC